MAHANGRIYIDRTVTPNIGVSIADIQAVLETSDDTIGLLCSDQTWDKSVTPPVLVPVQRINKWAKHKPVRHAKLGTLTDSERRYAFYGFDANGIYDNTYSGCFRSAVSNNGDWPYLAPRGITQSIQEAFRFPDFEEYKHTSYVDGLGRQVAACPILPGGPWSTISFQNLDYTEIQVKDIVSPADYSYFKNDSEFRSAKIFLLWGTGVSGAQVHIEQAYYVDEYQVQHDATYGDLLDGRNIQFPFDSAYQGKYLVAALSNCPGVSSLDGVDPEGDNSYEWMYLPRTLKLIPQETLTMDWSVFWQNDPADDPNVWWLIVRADLTNNFLGTQSFVSLTINSVTITGRSSSETDSYSDPAGDSISLQPGSSGRLVTSEIFLNPNYQAGETLDVVVSYTYTKTPASGTPETVTATKALTISKIH